ncbi:serine/threonine-protein kinase [Actinoplanes sp. NPDC051851]|uniref:serine/threonine-protein kinase n=1 Tax=Actinoplanes sp. NPDC051851 TaxID=3154753 RepID=UPI003412A02A
MGNSYELIRPIGQGATGTVWRGKDTATGEPVAIKLLHESLLRQPRLVTRFVQERTILLMLRHRNVVRVRDLFSVGETLGLVMDLVAAGSLRDHLIRHTTVPPAEACRLAAQVADALTEAHGLGIIHRDLKPDNILLGDENGRLETRLTDFGIARLLTVPSMTSPNAVVGTPHYMAPEAFQGTPPSPATDVYALGVLLYELVSGQPPYRSDSIPELMRLHESGDPVRRPGMPDPLWRLIRSCLSPAPRNRPPASGIAADLRALSRHLAGVPALPPPSFSSLSLFSSALSSARPSREGLGRWLRAVSAPARGLRPRWARGSVIRPGVAAAVVAGTVLVTGAAISTWNALHPSPPGPPAPSAASLPPAQAPAAPASRPVALPASPAARRHASPQPHPPSPVRHSRTRKPPAATRSPLPENDASYTPWQCTPGFVIDMFTRSPLAPRPCHSTGRTVRYRASLSAPAGGRARIEVTLRDATTGRTVAGPTTCAVRFTRRDFTRSCGPSGVTPRRGRRYTVVMTYRYERDGHTSASTTRGPIFTW